MMIKAQALAEFVVETSFNKVMQLEERAEEPSPSVKTSHNLWVLNVDTVVNASGAEAGVVLTLPEQHNSTGGEASELTSS